MILSSQNSVEITWLKSRSNNVSPCWIMKQYPVTASKNLEGFIHLLMNFPVALAEKESIQINVNPQTGYKASTHD